VTVSFEVPHPFDEDLVITCTADVKIVRKRLEYVRLFYTDPRDPESPYFSYSLSEGPSTKIKLAPIEKKSPIAIGKIKEEEEELQLTEEEFESMCVSQEIDMYFYSNICEILEEHGYRLGNDYGE